MSIEEHITAMRLALKEQEIDRTGRVLFKSTPKFEDPQPSLFLRRKVWWYDFTHNGDRYRASTGCTDRSAASRILADVFDAVKSGKPFINQRPNRSVSSLRPKGAAGGSIYFIQCSVTGRIKIGWSLDVQDRLARIQAMSATDLKLVGEIPGDQYREREIHQMFKNHRLHCEWFAPSQGILEYASCAQVSGT